MLFYCTFLFYLSLNFYSLFIVLLTKVISLLIIKIRDILYFDLYFERRIFLKMNIKQKLLNNDCLPQIKMIYNTDDSGAKLYTDRILNLIENYDSVFHDSSEQLRIFSAPGRTEIGGNHTDHQRGHVLAAGVNLDIVAAVKPNNSDVIQIKSDGYDMISIDLNQLDPIETEQGTTLSLVRGIAAHFINAGYTIKGFNAVMTSSVLKGSGLSSSAAFEVLVGTILNALYCQNAESAVKIAQIGQYAENVYFGKPCGLMDQTASSVGSFVAIDFKDAQHPIVEQIPFDFAAVHHSLCIVDTGGNHADLTPDYAAITTEMKSIASFFGKEVLSEISEQDVYNNVFELRQKYGDRAVLRAIHFFADDKKAVQEAQALKNNDFDTFKKLIIASGISSFTCLQNVYSNANPQEQGLSLALALCQKILGNQGAYRVHGGGFAGTIQAFVPTELLDTFHAEMESAFGKGKCHVLSIRPVGGVEIK